MITYFIMSTDNGLLKQRSMMFDHDDACKFAVDLSKREPEKVVALFTVMGQPARISVRSFRGGTEII